ncbi:MAG TPA: hypothetical protein VM577_14435, partial [Anaerovoracaceae bacterium]|nr:hypothetical protein [Anaerovoracaceae bacterium]
MFYPNRYHRNPAPNPAPNPNPDPDQIPSPGPNPNTNPSFGPYDNIGCITYSQVNLVNEMRYLCLQLVIWSRAYITNNAARQAAVPAIYERLYSVPNGFYPYMNLFFGQEIAEQFINLASQHIIIFANLINAMSIGNQQAASSSQSAWHENADGIASFLVQINNSWNINQWHNLLNRYLEMFLDEAIAVMSSDYRREIAIYDR